jgi:uncharacterized membrane-anchored protein
MTNIRFTSPLSDLGKVPTVTFGFWVVKVLATTLGETGGDWVSMSLNLEYLISSAIFTAIFVALVWSQVRALHFRPALYWATILFSQTLGTALGDWLAGSDRGGFGIGYEYGALVFGAGLAVVTALYTWTKVSHTILFWGAFILTRPLGATLGDLLDKPLANGGLNFSRWVAALVLLGCIVALIAFIPQRAV